MSVHSQTRTAFGWRGVISMLSCAAMGVGGALAVPAASAEETTAHSQVAINDSRYNRGEVLEVDGKPFWYNGLQIRIDKLRDDPAYGINDQQLQSVFDMAAEDGFTVANSQIRWLDLQPNHESQAVRTATVSSGAAAAAPEGTFAVNRSNTSGAQSIGLVQIDTDGMTAEQIDGAALRLYNTTKQNAGRTIKVYGLADDSWDEKNTDIAKSPVTLDANGDIVENDDVKLASQTINATTSDAVKAVHYYDFYLGKWIKQQAAKNPGDTKFSFAIQESGKGGADIDFASATNGDKALKPTLIYGDDQEFDYSVLDGAVDMAKKAGLKFEMLWFGLDTCSTSMDQRVPVWALDNTLHARTLDAQGRELMWKQSQPGGVYGVYSYLMDKNDTALVAKEASAMKSALNHVAGTKNADTFVGVQLSNEPRIGAIHGSKKADRSYSQVSNDLFAKLGLDVAQFREYTMWNYNNTLGEAVKTSKLPVWTRVNLDEYADTEGVKYNEAKRAAGGTNIDFIGIDHYRKTPAQLAQEGADDSQFAHGSNLPMVMELGQKDNRSGGLYLEQDALATLSGGTYWTIYDAASSDGTYIYDYDKATGKFSPIDDVIPGLFKTNNMLKKVGADLATNVAGERGRNQLVFFNPTSDASGDYSEDKVVGEQNNKYVNYSTSKNGVGIAINKSANDIVLLSNRESTFTLNNLAKKNIASAETGYYDADGTWHKDGDAKVTEQDGKSVIALNAYDVVRVTAKDGGFGKFQVKEEMLTKIFEAENLKRTLSEGVTADVYDDGASNGGWVKANAAKTGDSVSFTIDVPKDGIYQLSTRMLRANNRGMAEITVDGAKLDGSLDMYAAKKGFTTKAADENVDLTQGTHTVTYTVSGKNAASSGYVLGIDYIQIKQKGVSKSRLGALIEQAGKLKQSDYTSQTWDALSKALAQAETVFKDDNATTSTVSGAADALAQAIDALLPNTDKTSEQLQDELEKLIKEADAEIKKTDVYKAEDIAKLKSVRDNAQNMLGDPALSPEQWQKEVNTLRAAIDALKATVTTVDKTALRTAVAEADKLDEKAYTPDSWKPFAEALAAAHKVLEDDKADAKAVSDALTNLNDAKNGLVKAEVNPDPTPDPDTDLTTLAKESFDKQTEPENYGFDGKYASVADGKLTISGMGNETATATQLPIELAAQDKAGATFLWNAATGTQAKAGVQLTDEYGRLVFALTGAKQSEVRYGTAYSGDGATGVAVGKAATGNVEPKWAAVKADPSKIYRVRVTLDSKSKKVSFTVTPNEGGKAIIDGSADTTATSLSQLVVANYYGGATNTQTLDDITLRVADTTPDLPLKGKTVYAFGDSIVAGHRYASASFATFAAHAEGMDIQRFAKNGATIVGKESDKDSWISYQIDHAPSEAPDVVLFDGGTNDAENIKNGKTTVDAYRTAFADTVKQIHAKWPDAKIVFTAVPKLYTRDYGIQKQLHEVQVDVCKELGVTLADAYTAGGEGITEENKAQYSFSNVSSVTGLPEAGTNKESGTHPNLEGIRTFYLPTVRAALRAAFSEAPNPEPEPEPEPNPNPQPGDGGQHQGGAVTDGETDGSDKDAADKAGSKPLSNTGAGVTAVAVAVVLLAVASGVVLAVRRRA